MAAATITNQRKTNVAGHLREVMADSVAFAANGDTWDTGLLSIKKIDLTPTTNTAFGFTVSGGTITLVSAGALTFRGSVSGF